MYRASETAPVSPASVHTVVEMLRVAKLTRQYMQLAVWEAGLHAGQDELLDVLADTPLSFSAVADQVGIRSATLSKMIDRMVEKGLVERVKSLDDRRKMDVVLTPEGAEVQRLVRAIWERTEREVFGELSSSEIQQTLESLTTLHSQLKVRLRRLR
ncbi:MarR family transcriptional regulator [Aurantimonas sp. A2-1-M11]|uniref:MarR family winged helix-turn-helix transcriptional regulator n=1 Tax=Aurantimonas sp. A2-1-M11 TaxID=3113712 RepID=UPI002F922079